MDRTPKISHIWGEVLARSFPHRKTQKIWEWAEDNITLPGSFSQPGKFDCSGSNYLKDPLDSALDDSCRSICVLKASRSGGSLLLDLLIPYWVANKASPIQHVFATQQACEEHLATRLMPIIRNTKAVASQLPTRPYDIKKDSIIFDSFFYLAGSQTPRIS